MKECTGCGKYNSEPLGLNKNGEPYLACCPDNNYVEVEPMTPKEKAEELVLKFTIDLEPYAEWGKWERWQGKKCALIAVDEILEIVKSDDSALIVELPYWQDVKQEIKNL